MSNAQDCHFSVAGDVCRAYWYPARNSAAKKRPCIVMAHGLAAIKEMRLPAYAEHFAEAGFHVLIFDYRCFGSSDGQPRQWLDIPRQHTDWSAAIDFAKSRAGVEGIALWGTSLSGGHVIHIANERTDVRCILAQVPHVDGRASSGEVQYAVLFRLLVKALADKINASLGRAPIYIQSSGEPGELALMTAAGESPGYLALVPAATTLDRRVTARFLLQVLNYSPAKTLSKLSIPSLIQVGLADKTTPAQAAIDAAKDNIHCTLSCYDTGHFEPYLPPVFDGFVREQIDFLTRIFDDEP